MAMPSSPMSNKSSCQPSSQATSSSWTISALTRSRGFGKPLKPPAQSCFIQADLNHTAISGVVTIADAAYSAAAMPTVSRHARHGGRAKAGSQFERRRGKIHHGCQTAVWSGRSHDNPLARGFRCLNQSLARALSGGSRRKLSRCGVHVKRRAGSQTHARQKLLRPATPTVQPEAYPLRYHAAR